MTYWLGEGHKICLTKIMILKTFLTQKNLVLHAFCPRSEMIFLTNCLHTHRDISPHVNTHTYSQETTHLHIHRSHAHTHTHIYTHIHTHTHTYTTGEDG